jgi:hypothetical protein
MNMNDEKVGVLGLMKDERSLADQKLLNQYGCSEKYDVSAVGVTEIPAEYRYGWEERSIKDKMMLSQFGTCKGKENYNCMGSTGPAGKENYNCMGSTGPAGKESYTGSTGPGDNYYNPGICHLKATSLTPDGWIQWEYNDPNNVPTKGFHIGNNDGKGQNTSIIPHFFGNFQIMINGGMIGNGSSIFLTFNNINVKQHNIWVQSYSQNGVGYTCSAHATARPYTNPNLSGFEFKLTNAGLWAGHELLATINFIGS